jgi:hypothetical protein
MFLPVAEILDKMKEISCRVAYPYSMYADPAFSKVLDPHPSPNDQNAALKEMINGFLLF